ncbi:MAG: hypothetical protein H8D92_02550 [Pelagibacteraceae bacterium]|nr:hypothetical protein [Pelagibacteraceae bacterium]
MKKILLVSGCSFTDPNMVSVPHPDLDTSWPKWPELVAKELDMDCVNLALSGSGNERIYSSISDYLTQPYAVRKGMTYHKPDIGLVVAAWSQGNRRDWSKRKLVTRTQKQDSWTNMNFDDKGDLYYWLLKSVRYQYAYQNLCKQLKLPYVQFQMISLWRAYVHFKIDELGKDRQHWETEMKECLAATGYNELMNTNFLGWPSCVINNKYWNEKSWTLSDCLKQQDKISDTDRHPNKQGHEKLAEEFLKHYNENKIL